MPQIEYQIGGLASAFASGVLGRTWPTYTEAAAALDAYRAKVYADPLLSDRYRIEHLAPARIIGRVVGDWHPIPDPRYAHGGIVLAADGSLLPPIAPPVWTEPDGPEIHVPLRRPEP